MNNAPQRCEAKMEMARTDDHGHVQRTEVDETFTEPRQCELASGHAGQHHAKSTDGEIFEWDD